MNNIVGHNKIIESLKSIIKSGKISNAYLFCGIDGIGKFLIAKEFAKSILCLDPKDGVYCDVCESCKSFSSTSDLVVLESEDGLIKVDAVRSLCREIMLKPTISDRKVFIINDADTMGDPAQNALLKSLEEPPKYATLILIASNKSMLRKTILSRCVTIDFSSLSNYELKQIANKYGIILDDAILDYCGGSIGKAIRLTQCGYFDLVEELEKAINSGSLIEMNRALVELKKYKTIKEEINDILNLLINKLSKSLTNDCNRRVKQISIIEEVNENIKRNINFEDSLDYMIVRIWEEGNRRK